MSKYPISIDNAPLVEAFIEVRFSNDQSSEVIFGKLYSYLSEKYPEIERLPSLSIPQDLKESQEQFMYVGDYRLKNDRFLITIGKRVIAVSRVCNEIKYVNWAEIKDATVEVLETLEKVLPHVDSANSIEVNYLNAFQNETLEEALDLSVMLKKVNLVEQENLFISFNMQTTKGNKLTTNLGSNAQLTMPGMSIQSATLNISCKHEEGVPFSQLIDKIEELHSEVETSFYESVKDSYVNAHNPVYE